VQGQECIPGREQVLEQVGKAGRADNPEVDPFVQVDMLHMRVEQPLQS